MPLFFQSFTKEKGKKKNYAGNGKPLPTLVGSTRKMRRRKIKQVAPSP
jgi:hypothetical protein